MRAVSRLSQIIFLLFLFLALLTTKSFAADFNSLYKVTYDIAEDGKTIVKQDISIVNQTKNKYATKYNLSVGTTNISNIKSRDPGGEIKPEIITKDEGFDITLNFNEKVIGEGKALNFFLNYETPEVAVKNGSLWEINIPKLATEENITDYSLLLLVPKSFGPTHYVSPTPIESKEETKKSFSFSKENLLNSGVVAAFGVSQVFDLTLKYHLSNPDLFKAYTEIALPPDTPYQQVNYLSIDPKPYSISTDRDGNYLAKYFLDAGKKVDVVTKLQIKTLSNETSFPSKKWTPEA